MPARYRCITRVLAYGRVLVGPIAAGLLWLLPLLALAGGPGWQPGFNTPGLNGDVKRVVQWHGNAFVAGGDFTDAGGEAGADHVARWDGRRWRALGTGPGFSGPYSYLVDLVALPGGDLVAAGGWDDTIAVTSIVTRWNGRRWQRLGPGFGFRNINALAVTPGGELLLGLSSTDRAIPSGLQRWNGTAWQPLEPAPAPGGPVSSIYQLVVTPTGDILAAGYLRGADGAGFEGVGRWTGTAWQQLGTDFPEPRSLRLAVGADGAGLVSSPRPVGLAATAGGLPTSVLRWDGRAWQPFGPPPTGQVHELHLSFNGDVLAYGRFRLPADTLTRGCARYDGTRWQVLNLSRPDVGPSRGIVGVSAGGEVLANTRFYGLMRWDGRRWRELANARLAGIPGRHLYLPALAVTPGGEMLLAGKTRDDGRRGLGYHVARWNGRRVEALPGGPEGHLEALAVLPGGDVVVAGQFDRLPAGTSGSLLRYDGRRWHNLAVPPTGLSVLLVAPDGRLLAGGLGGVARWDGVAWQQLGDLAHTPGFGAGVEALALAPNGDILAGGAVPSSEPYQQYESSRVARWNGAGWQVVPESVDFSIQALVVRPDGEVLAGGSTTHDGHGHQSTRGYLQRWTGQEWQPIGPELEGGINALALAPDGSIVAGGRFEDAGGNPRADYVARWDGTAWQALGMGLNGAVDALRVLPNGDVAVSGNFTDTGDDGLPMWHLGLYRVQ